MHLEVNVTEASLGDVVDVVFDNDGDEVMTTTLGDVIADKLLARLQADPRWDGLTARFWDAVDKYMREAAPAAVAELVRGEVARQLGQVTQTAAVRGNPSTRAEAIVATEVTTQLRAQFTPVVERALTVLRRDLEAASQEAVETFRRGLGHG